MASRSDRSSALRWLAARIGELGADVLAGLDRLRSALEESELDEEDRSAYLPEFEAAAGVLTGAVAEGFDRQRARLTALAEALEGAALAGVAASAARSAPQATAGPATAAPARAPSGRFTGEVIPYRGRNFEVWSFAGADPGTFDWGVDPDFPRHFETQPWKGHTASDYRELTAKAPAMMALCRTSGPGEIQGDLGFVRDAYFSSEPVRLEVTADGKVHVGGGRHRLMAAIEGGASIPVSVTRQGPQGWKETGPLT